MVCPCGCARRDVSRLTRRRVEGLHRSRYRSIGQSAGAQVQDFVVTNYVPADIQNDVATGTAYYNQFQQATSGVSFKNGTLQLSPAASQAALGAFEAGLTAAAPVLGVALAAFLAIAPKAGAGPGQCVSNPPPGPLLSQLQGWSDFLSWQKFFGPYNVGAPGSFEAWANPILEYNWILDNNCYSNKWIPPAILLATLVSAWNAKHMGPARKICRSGLNPPSWGLGPGYDPIANALENALVVHCPPPPSTGNAFEDATAPRPPCTPNNVTSCVAVNGGPFQAHVIPLTLHPTAAHQSLTAAAAKPITATNAAQEAMRGVPTALVVGGGLGLAAWIWRKPLAKMLGIRL